HPTRSSAGPPRRRAAMTLARAAWTALVVLLFAAPAARAQTGSISGTVTDSSGAAVSGAEVRIDGTSIHGLTDDTGRYQLKDIPPGAHTIRVLQLGYHTTTRAITLEAGGAQTV